MTRAHGVAMALLLAAAIGTGLAARSMLHFGYQLPPNGPHIDGAKAFPK
jgi:hypothetical protein